MADDLSRDDSWELECKAGIYTVRAMFFYETAGGAYVYQVTITNEFGDVIWDYETSIFTRSIRSAIRTVWNDFVEYSTESFRKASEELPQ